MRPLKTSFLESLDRGLNFSFLRIEKIFFLQKVIASQSQKVADNSRFRLMVFHKRDIYLELKKK